MGRRTHDSAFEVGNDFEVGLGDEYEADHGIHFSGSGSRARETLINVEPKRARRSVVPDSAEVSGIEGPHWSAGDEDRANAENLVAEDEVHIQIEDVLSTRRRYVSSDNPMQPWREFVPQYLDELYRAEGLGDYLRTPQCAFCEARFGDAAKTRIFRCRDCGEMLQCLECVKSRHELTPLHVLQEWSGTCWQPAWLHRADLKDDAPGLGMHFQLGHHGRPCPAADTLKPQRRLVVIDSGGVFTLNVSFCGCSLAMQQDHKTQLLRNAWYPATVSSPATCATFRVLELFGSLSSVGSANAHDFVRSLERMNDPNNVHPAPDRYKAFARMHRQYAFLKRMKNAGCGYKGLRADLAAPGVGQLAVRCWACPRPGFNLPPDWQQRAQQFLYMLIIAIDANFRLKNRLRANERHDKILGDGWGVFVGEAAYREHLVNYIAEDDASNCIAFAALMQKETKHTTGLRVSGVGGCVCARHGVVMPHGLGDLQKGERYANMDFIVLAMLFFAAGIVRILLSYDIACQWKQRLRQRAERIETPGFATRLNGLEISFGLPVWHSVAHLPECQAENGICYCPGAGRTDGEGIERTWSVLNTIAPMTKEMGEGNRQDTTEAKIAHISHEKNVGQLVTLPRKVSIAIVEWEKQVAEFEEIDDGLFESVRERWMEMVTSWLADKTKPNPYIMEGGKLSGPSEARVLADLKQAELEDIRAGRGEAAEQKMSAAAFIKGKLQLQQLQRRIRVEVKGSRVLTADRERQLDELRIAFFKKLRVIERHEATYMPGVVELRGEEEEMRDPDVAPPKAEDVKIWFPSDVAEGNRGRVCRSGLVEVEVQLRVAQCGDALASIRGRLHAKQHLIIFRNSNVTGQRASTRSATLIARVGEQIESDAQKYRDARAALTSLKGAGFANTFKELKAEDLSVRAAEEESDARARAALGRVDSSHRVRAEPSQAPRRVSWIWFVGGDVDEGEIHDSVRVQWSKALARRDRWTEEVALLREEMKRVIRSIVAEAKEWEQRAEVLREGVQDAIAAGAQAHARRQATGRMQMAENFVDEWERSELAGMRYVFARDGPIYRRILAGEPEDGDARV